MNKPKEHEYFRCHCKSPRHNMVVGYMEDDPEWSEIYIELQVNHFMGFWKRLWTGIKWVFGYKSDFGAYDVISLHEKDTQRLIDTLEERKEFLWKRK